MKRFLCAAVLSTSAWAAGATDVGVSITVGEPGFYGRIDIGTFPRPEVIYAEPVIIERRVTMREPVYMHVPPGHAKDWKKHCHKYDACGRPVYFVKERWYETVYVPEYQRKHGGGKGPKGGNGGGKEKGGNPGKGHGKGKD